jgi:hypothetical protein
VSELQQTEEWINARLGKVTASRMGDIMAKTKSGPSASRKNYRAELMVERLTGLPCRIRTSLATRVHPAAWDAWLRGLPESEKHRGQARDAWLHRLSTGVEIRSAGKTGERNDEVSIYCMRVHVAGLGRIGAGAKRQSRSWSHARLQRWS